MPVKKRGAALVAALAFLSFSASAENRPANPAVDCTDGLMSIRAHAAPIDRILGEMARSCNVTIVLQESIDTPLSIDIERMTPQRAVKRILRDYSFILSYARPSVSTSNWLWVLADSPSQPSRVEIIQAGFPIAADRQEAIYLLGEDSGELSVNLLRNALADPDRDVREAAVETLGEIGGDEAAVAVAIALNDPDLDVRETAADALGQIGGDVSIQLLRQMTADRHAVVREAAADNLEQLTEAM